MGGSLLWHGENHGLLVNVVANVVNEKSFQTIRKKRFETRFRQSTNPLTFLEGLSKSYTASISHDRPRSGD